MFVVHPDLNCRRMRTRTAKTPRLRLSSFSRLRCSNEPGRRARLRDGSFSPGVTFGTQSSAIKAVCKNIRSTGISLYTRRRRRSRGITRPPEHITSSPGISRHDLSRSAGKRSGISWADGREREGETGSVKIRRNRGTRSMKEERKNYVERERTKKPGRRRKKARVRKGRATSARSRATIRDHLPSSVELFVLDLSGGGRKEYDKTLRRRRCRCYYQIIHSHRALSIFEAVRS